MLQLDTLGRVAGLEGSELSFQPRHHRHPVQTELVAALQDINPGSRCRCSFQRCILEDQCLEDASTEA